MKLAGTLLLILLTSTFGCPPPLEEKPESRSSKAINYRLPRNIEPRRYEIILEPRLEPNLDPATFTGFVNIEITPTENTNNITLHTRQLNITEDSIVVTHSSGEKLPISEILTVPEKEFYVIKVGGILKQNEFYNLTIGHYLGILNLENGGFYLAKYYDMQGRERRFATTQFQSTSARRAFPCFDEPHLKANFITHLVRQHDFSSISNEELKSTTSLPDGRAMDNYKESVKMSTYLNAFVVSEYKHTAQIKNQRVFADEYAINDGQAEYALQSGIEVLSALENFVNVKYSLAKLDQIGIPDDHFAPGAMENWGLVTYRKSYIVYPYSSATSSEHQRTIQIIAHEYSHQWFGNLVTCDWWGLIWLNEGFANYFESFAAALVRPDWKLEQHFLLSSVHSALERDSTNTTAPMNYITDSPSGPPSFISYQKAGSVIRMFEHFITNSVFRKGLTRYLNKHSYSSVKPNDLYEALQQTLDAENKDHLLGGLTFSKIMSTWDSQTGYPVVNVIRNYITGNVQLHQERFFNRDYNVEDNSTWIIPINFYKGDVSDTRADFWMTKKSENAGYWSPSSWIILNKQQTGFYRVNYDDTNWNLISSHLINNNIDSIHILNRAQLLDDSDAFADAGKLNYTVALSLTKYIEKETGFAPLSVFYKILRLLNKMLAATPDYPLYWNYVLRSLTGAYNHLGFSENSDDPHLDKLTRPEVLNWLCKAGHEECRQKALTSLREWKSDSGAIKPNLESAVFCGAMKVGTIDDWKFLFEKYQKAGNTTQRSRLLSGLGCSEDKNILNRFLDKVRLDDGTLNRKDWYNAFINVLSASNVGLNTVFDYIDDYYDTLKTKISLPSVLREIGSRFTTQGQLDKMLKLGNKYSLSTSSIKSIVSGTRSNIDWAEKYLTDIRQWITENDKTANIS